MITSVKMGDFLAHKDTTIQLENGVTVFIGNNGAGKSSVIDAITFALFGKHTRSKSKNKNLIRKGSKACYAEVEFHILGKKYVAVRKLDKDGLAAKFTEDRGGEMVELAAGERKQYGESMTAEIEARIGLDYEKLKIASIVHQGELDAITEKEPIKFKEIVNKSIGSDDLDMASGSMSDVIKGFRRSIMEKVKHDDTEIRALEAEMNDKKEKAENARPRKAKLEKDKTAIKEKIAKLQEEIDAAVEMANKVEQLGSKEADLRDHAKEKTASIKEKITDAKLKVKKCKGCFGPASQLKGLKEKKSELQKQIERIDDVIRTAREDIRELKVKMDVAEKLQLKDGKCPVCDSKVDKLNEWYHKGHLEERVKSLNSDLDKKTKERKSVVDEKNKVEKGLEGAQAAQTTLDTYHITSNDQLERLQSEIKANEGKIPADNASLEELSKIDERAASLYNSIKSLKEQTKGFDQKQLACTRKELDEAKSDQDAITLGIGTMLERIKEGEESVAKNSSILKELYPAKSYIAHLENIHKVVFDSNGPVAKTLRSWALKVIAENASEYLDRFNTKINRVRLEEESAAKRSRINIRCYTNKSELDISSLSGGEKVSAAIAVRLGMAKLLGASNLGIMILDEPTANLDAERKKSLVDILTELVTIQNEESQMQFLIITHDSEIFENTAVENVYEFKDGPDGAIVNRL